MRPDTTILRAGLADPAALSGLVQRIAGLGLEVIGLSPRDTAIGTMTDRAHRQETRIRLLPGHLRQPDGGRRWPRRDRTRLALLPALPVTLRLARVKPAVREVLERDGLLDRIGDDKTHGNVDQAVEAQIPAEGGSRADI